MRSLLAGLIVCLLPSLLASPPLGAQAPTTPDAVEQYSQWLQAYSEGKTFLFRDGQRDAMAVKRFRRLFAQVAQSKDLLAAKRLWQAAIVELPPELDKFQRLDAQLATVRGEAKQLIAGIPDEKVDSWLLDKALQRGGRSGSLPRVIAIEILGLRGNERVGKELLAGLRKFAVDERIQAVLALENCGSLDTLPELLKLLRNREPNLRIATITAISGILAPHSDETKAENVKSDSPGAKLSPEVIEAFAKILKKEKNWQVRATIVGRDGSLAFAPRDPGPDCRDEARARARRAQGRHGRRDAACAHP